MVHGLPEENDPGGGRTAVGQKRNSANSYSNTPPGSPQRKHPSPQPVQPWHSPVRQPRTSVATAPTAPPPLPARPTPQSPIQRAPIVTTGRTQRQPALLPASPLEPLLPPWPMAGGMGGGGGGTPPGPGQPLRSPLPSPSPPPNDDNDNDIYDQNLPMGRPPPNAEEPTRE